MAEDADRDWTVRRAAPDDHAAVLGVLDGANLATDGDAIRAAIACDAVIVAESADSTILGALVLDGDEITHVAVRRGRRGQGIGAALVAAAVAELASLRAEFHADARPFYAALGFDIEPVADEDDRFVGRIHFDDRSDERFDQFAAGGE